MSHLEGGDRRFRNSRSCSTTPATLGCMKPCQNKQISSLSEVLKLGEFRNVGGLTAPPGCEVLSHIHNIPVGRGGHWQVGPVRRKWRSRAGRVIYGQDGSLSAIIKLGEGDLCSVGREIR